MLEKPQEETIKVMHRDTIKLIRKRAEYKSSPTLYSVSYQILTKDRNDEVIPLTVVNQEKTCGKQEKRKTYVVTHLDPIFLTDTLELAGNLLTCALQREQSPTGEASALQELALFEYLMHQISPLYRGSPTMIRIIVNAALLKRGYNPREITDPQATNFYSYTHSFEEYIKIWPRANSF